MADARFRPLSAGQLQTNIGPNLGHRVLRAYTVENPKLLKLGAMAKSLSFSPSIEALSQGIRNLSSLRMAICHGSVSCKVITKLEALDGLMLSVALVSQDPIGANGST